MIQALKQLSIVIYLYSYKYIIYKLYKYKPIMFLLSHLLSKPTHRTNVQKINAKISISHSHIMFGCKTHPHGLLYPWVFPHRISQVLILLFRVNHIDFKHMVVQYLWIFLRILYVLPFILVITNKSFFSTITKNPSRIRTQPSGTWRGMSDAYPFS